MLAATTAKSFSLIDNATSIVFHTSPRLVENADGNTVLIVNFFRKQKTISNP